MHKRSVVWSLFSVLLIVVVIAVGCAPKATPTPTPKPAAQPTQAPAAQKKPITLWFNTLFHSGDAQAMERIVKKFNEEHTDVKIKLTQGQWEQYYAQLANSVVAGNPPQIAIVHTNKLSEMYPALMPLDDDLLAEAGINGKDYIPKLWKAGVRDGKRYLIPLDTHMFGLWYNKDIFKKAGLDPEKPPQTMEEFVKAADAIRDAGFKAFHPAEDEKPRKLRRAWYVFFWQQGGELFDKGYTKATFNNEKGLKALKFLVSIVQEHKWNSPGSDGFKQFTSGELGMLVAGNWMYWTAKKSGVNWGMTYMPQFFDRRMTWANSHNMVIPKQPEGTPREVIVAAAKAIKWINEHSYIWGIYGGHIPAYLPALESEELRNSDTWKRSLSKFTDMAKNGWIHYPIDHPKGSKMEKAIQTYIQQAYNGEISPEEALKKAEEEVNAILQEK